MLRAAGTPEISVQHCLYFSSGNLNYDNSPKSQQVVTNAKSDTKVPLDQGSSRSESPLPQQPQQPENDTTRRRKRKRQLKSKTYMNDEGFMDERRPREKTPASQERGRHPCLGMLLREMLNLHQRTETGSATTRDNLIRIDSVKFTIYDKRTIFMYSTLNFLIKSVPAQDFY
ncbi:hypothetical protein ACROYT_G014727 [Oculina patagonica]